MKQIIYALIIILITIGQFGCVDTINFNLLKENERLVISGQLTDVLEWQEVRITKSLLLDKEATVVEEIVPDAKVAILHGNEVIELYYADNGRYRAILQGLTGESYQLQVNYNNQIYLSSLEKMPAKSVPAVPASKKIQVETLTSAGNLVTETKIQLQASGPIQNDEYFLFRSTGEYEYKEYEPMSTMNKSCYIPTDIDQGIVSVVSADKLKSNQLDEWPIMQLIPDDRFFTYFCFHMRQYNINRKAYEYWDKLSRVLTTGNGLFEAPPGKLLGNIKNTNNADEEVLGYFTLGAAQSYKHFTNKSILQVNVKDPCGFNFNQPRPVSCSECLTIANATAIKPSYWP